MLFLGKVKIVRFPVNSSEKRSIGKLGVIKEADNDIYVEVNVKIAVKIDVDVDVDVDTGVTGSKKGHNIEVDGA